MRRLPLLAAFVCAAAVAGAGLHDARANGPGLPDTLAVSLKPGDAVDVGIEANFGFLEAPDGTNFTWTCHDVLIPATASLTPLFFRNSANNFLVSVRSLGIANDPSVSLFYSPDGCDYFSVTGLTNVLIPSAAFDPADPNHALAVSATGASTPVPNGVFVSNDAGHTWTATSLMTPQRFFRTVKFSQTNPLIAYASANWYTPTPQAWIYSSTDGGISWAEHPWTFTPSGGTLQTNVDIAAISPTNGNLVYVRTDGTVDYLLRSSDGGATFGVVHATTSNDDIRSTEYDATDGSLWTAAKDFGTFRSTDGFLFSPIPVPSPKPHLRGLGSDARGMFAVANNYSDGFALGLSTNAGLSFLPVFQFNQLTGVRACPAGSQVATVCGPLFPALQQTLGIVTPTPSPTPTPGSGKDPGCKCDFGAEGTAPLGAALTTLLALGAAAARRRTRA